MLARITFAVATLVMVHVYADLRGISDLEPIEVISPSPIDGAPLCKINYVSEQLYTVYEHLRAIEQAVQCSQLEKARLISKSLTHFLAGQATTALGICYDDRRCQQSMSASQVTKGTCSAANGKSWVQTIPVAGTCEIVR